MTTFLDDARGRHQVQFLFQSSHSSFGALLLLLSTLYREGLDDLSSTCAPLWEFMDYVTEGIQNATDKR